MKKCITKMIDESDGVLDLDKLFNFAFGDQGALNNVGIGLGYVS